MRKERGRKKYKDKRNSPCLTNMLLYTMRNLYNFQSYLSPCLTDQVIRMIEEEIELSILP